MAVTCASAVLLGVCLCARGADKKKSTDDFETLLMRPRSVPMTRRQGKIVRTVRKLPWTLDGSMVVDRKCVIRRDAGSGWSLVQFPRDGNRPFLRPRWLLPNSLLETVEPLLDKSHKQVFRISGETAIYQERVFLLMKKLTLQATSLPKAKPPEWKSDPSKGWPNPTTAPAAGRQKLAVTPRHWSGTTTRPTTMSTRRPTAMPATRPAEFTPRRMPRKKGASAADILKGLMRDRPGSPVIAPVAGPIDPAATRSEAAPTTGREIQPSAKGKLIVDRIIRVLATGDGQWKEVRFEADNTLREPPIRLLPCRHLEWAEAFVGGTNKLRISGLVTQYKGRRYLLLRKVLRVRDMNQF